ncbi:MAG: metallophosphoesterase [Clostridia bacterium]|nr:metallophosphoesterase [Clostridia bacterium]
MKRIGVISDTHFDRGRMEFALMKMEAEGRLDCLIHCGDVADDAAFIGGNILQVVAVRGNCDGWMSDAPIEQELNIAGIRFFITHGHRYGVKSDTGTLAEIAATRGAQICCFGHTHIPFCEYERGVLMLNPGACCNTGNCALILADERGGFDVRMLTRD